MKCTGYKKYVWIVLIFSLAVNIGFLMVVAEKKLSRFYYAAGPRLNAVSEIIDELSLKNDTRERVESLFDQLKDIHRQRAAKMLDQNKQVLQILAKPGPLDEERLYREIKVYGQIRLESGQLAFAHILKIREELESENTALLFSELLKELNHRHDIRSPGY